MDFVSLKCKIEQILENVLVIVETRLIVQGRLKHKT